MPPDGGEPPDRGQLTKSKKKRLRELERESRVQEPILYYAYVGGGGGGGCTYVRTYT